MKPGRASGGRIERAGVTAEKSHCPPQPRGVGRAGRGSLGIGEGELPFLRPTLTNSTPIPTSPASPRIEVYAASMTRPRALMASLLPFLSFRFAVSPTSVLFPAFLLLPSLSTVCLLQYLLSS